jgi:hypothetical protein
VVGLEEDEQQRSFHNHHFLPYHPLEKERKKRNPDTTQHNATQLLLLAGYY